MSGWVMQTVRGVFENIGVIQESMETIARPHGIVDAPEATELEVTNGAIRFEHVTFHYGRDEGVFEDLSLDHRARREGRAGRRLAAPASRPSPRCSCACTTSRAGAS